MFFPGFYDFNGPADFTDTFNEGDDAFTDFTVQAGKMRSLSRTAILVLTQLRLSTPKGVARLECPGRLFTRWI